MNDIIINPQPLPRTLYLNEVTQSTITALTRDINSINKHDEYLCDLMKLSDSIYKPKPILLYIDSYGGDAYAMFGFLNIMERSKVPIHTIVTGCAMSCGFIIAANGHKRFAHKYSTFMYHQISSWTRGKVETIKEDLNEGNRLMEVLYSNLTNKTKLKKAKLLSVDKNRSDWFMTSNEALDFGVIDNIL